MTQTNQKPRSDLECREQALAGVRDAIAALRGVPVITLDREKHDTILEVADDLQGLERALTNETEQIWEADRDER